MLRRRRALGLTQKQVAHAVGVVQTTYSYWERGVCEPDRKSLRALGQVLQCSAESFLVEGK